MKSFAVRMLIHVLYSGGCRIYPKLFRPLSFLPFISVVRLLDFHNRSSKIIVQEVSIDDRL